MVKVRHIEQKKNTLTNNYIVTVTFFCVFFVFFFVAENLIVKLID